MKIPISSRVFWVTTVIVGLLEAHWFVRENIRAIGLAGLLIYLTLFSPALLAVASAVGFLVATLNSVVFLLVFRKPNAISHELKLNSPSAKLTFAMILGGCISTTLTLVLENYTHTLATVGGPLVVWWSLWAVSVIMLRHVLNVLLNRQRNHKSQAKI